MFYPLFLLKQYHMVPTLEQGRKFSFAFFMSVAVGLLWRWSEIIPSRKDAGFSVLWGFLGEDSVELHIQTISHSADQAALTREGLAVENCSLGKARGKMTVEQNGCSNRPSSKGESSATSGRVERKNSSVLLQTLHFIEPQISLLECIHFAGIQKKAKWNGLEVR